MIKSIGQNGDDFVIMDLVSMISSFKHLNAFSKFFDSVGSEKQYVLNSLMVVDMSPYFILNRTKETFCDILLCFPTWPEDEEAESDSDRSWAVHHHHPRVTGAHLENF